MHANYEALAGLARQAREDFEVNRVARPLLARLYGAYNPDIANLDTFLDQAAEMFPANNCGLTAVYLQHRLQDGEIIPAWPRSPDNRFGTYQGENHTFLRLGSLVVDITADQFGGPPIYVSPLQEPWKINQQ